MNRKEEYLALTKELESGTPDLRESVRKAQLRRRRKRLVYRPLAGMAACFALFVALVNFCTPVASACARVPVLRELAAAVTFSRSLSDAVENDYVQELHLSQTQQDITAEIDYLIVDRRQVNVFYRLSSDRYAYLGAGCEIFAADGSKPECCTYASNLFHAANGELRTLTSDFEGDVPDKLLLRMTVYDGEAERWETGLAEFEFLLEFDPQFTEKGEVIPLDRTVEMDGQKITFTQLEIYPTHIRVDVEDSPENTAWLRSLRFCIETEGGRRFEPVTNGISATGSPDSPAMVSYRAESTWFARAKKLKLVVTGAQWLRKDMEKTYVNLQTGETGPLPDGASFLSAEKNGSGWLVTFRSGCTEGEPIGQLFGSIYYDADGNSYEINEFSTSDDGERVTHWLWLTDYPYDEVWLRPSFSSSWTAEQEIVIAR